jgi:hypothetical protein
MKVSGFRIMSAFAAGCVTAAGLGWGVNLSAAAAARAQYDTSSQGAIHVCIGTDAVLRLADASRVCGPNEKSLQIQAMGGDAASAKTSNTHGEERRIADLEKRLSALEASAARGQKNDNKIVKVVAPFEVVDRFGRTVFRVSEAGAGLFNGDGKSVAELRATERGGFFIGRSAGAQLLTTVGTSGMSAGLKITEGDSTTSISAESPNTGPIA